MKISDNRANISRRYDDVLEVCFLSGHSVVWYGLTFHSSHYRSFQRRSSHHWTGEKINARGNV